MKKVFMFAVVAAATLAFSSCAITQSPVSAFVYTDVKAPVAVTGNTGSSKVGTSEVKGILGIVSTGDASVEAAAKSAGITKIHHVDYQAKSVLGIVASYTTIVYGE